jgi:hypothetical protein
MTEEHHFTLEDGAVMLDPDLELRYPDSSSVNRAQSSLCPTTRPPPRPIASFPKDIDEFHQIPRRVLPNDRATAPKGYRDRSQAISRVPPNDLASARNDAATAAKGDRDRSIATSRVLPMIAMALLPRRAVG